MQSAMQTLCQGSPAGSALVQAIGQGGAEARAWVAAWYFTDCPAANDAAQEFIKSLSAQQPDTALTYAQNWVDACQQIGLGELRRLHAAAALLAAPPALFYAPWQAAPAQGDRKLPAKQRGGDAMMMLQRAQHPCLAVSCSS